MNFDSLKIERLTNPGEETQKFLWGKLQAYGLSKLNNPDLETVEFFSLLVRKDEKIIAGALCYLFFKGLNLQLLWVDEEQRGNNLGATLLKRIEEEAKILGATIVFGYSFGFQAPKFYLKYGYKQVGIIEDYPIGQNCYFLSKRLSPHQ